MSNFLTQNDNGGSGLPYISWKAQAVQWVKKSGEAEQVFTPTTAIFDMDNLKVGWIKIGVGVYDAILAPYADKEAMPDRPSEMKDEKGKQVPAYKRGFQVNVLFGKDFGEDRLFSFSSSQKGALEAVGGLLTQYEEEKAANAGKVPVVTFSGHTNKTYGKGSTNIPGMSITSWVDRPQELNADSQPAQQAAPTPVAQAVGSEF